MGRELMAPFLFVCPGCGARARATESAVVKHRCPRRRQLVTVYHLIPEPDGCKVSV